MSDLQLSLLVIGAVVVGGVYLFNWVQERKFRRKLGEAFESNREEVLLEPAGENEARVEPQLSWSDAPRDEQHGVPNPRPLPARTINGTTQDGPPFDRDIHFVAVFESAVPISEPVIEELIARAAACGKPYRVAAQAAHGEWQEISRAGSEHHSRIALAVQLVDRKGPVAAAQLSILRDTLNSVAARISAVVSCPDVDAAAERARELDAFCSDVDIAIGVNIVAAEGPFVGQRIRALAEAAGFKLEPDGLFHYRDAQRHTLFTLDNHEPAPFIPEQISRLSTSGITLLLDVPRVADGPAVFDRMVDVGRTLARSLGGRLVDDNRAELNDGGIAQIREQLSQISARMDAYGISAGGTRALRLFA
jgi:hypothetical protein